MGQIFVKDLGYRNIAGDVPTAEENAVFEKELSGSTINLAIDEPDPGYAGLYQQSEGQPYSPRLIAGSEPSDAETELFKDQITASQFERPYVPPQAVPPPKLKSRIRQTYGLPESYRSTFEGTGSILGEFGGRVFGGLAGATPVALAATGGASLPAGVILGGLAGDAMGAAAGNTVYQVGDSIARYLGDEPPRHRTWYGPLGEQLGAGAEAAKWNMGVGSLGRILGEGLRWGGRKFFGTGTKEAEQAARASDAEGTGLSLVDVSGKARTVAIPMAALPVVGQVFKAHAKKLGYRITDDFTNFLDELAPLKSAQEIGHNWMDIVRKENKAFRNTLKTLRQNLYETSAKYGDPEFIPANAFRDQAEKMLDTMRRGEKKLPSGDMWEPSSPEYQKVLQQLQQYANIKNLSIPQYRALMADVGSLFDKAKNIGLPADEIADLRGALESGLYNKSINFGGPGAKELVEGVNALKNTFLEGIGKYQTATAKRSFGRVERDILTGGYLKPGSIEADEVFRAAWRPGSLDTIKNLEKLIGPEGIQQGLRSQIDTALENAMVVVKDTGEDAASEIRFNAPQFRKALGLDTQEGKETLQYILKDSGIGLARMDQLAKRLDILHEVNLPKLSTFLTRRVTLGGLQGLTGAIMFGQASPLGALLAMGVLYKGAKFMTDPDVLKSLTTDWKPNTSAKKKWAITEKILREHILDETPPEVLLGTQVDTFDTGEQRSRDIRGSGLVTDEQLRQENVQRVDDEIRNIELQLRQEGQAASLVGGEFKTDRDFNKTPRTEVIQQLQTQLEALQAERAHLGDPLSPERKSILDGLSEEASDIVKKLGKSYEKLSPDLRKDLETGLGETLGYEENIPSYLQTPDWWLKFR